MIDEVPTQISEAWTKAEPNMGSIRYFLARLKGDPKRMEHFH
jgi:hypothetical protein